jgi:hypothetical protein
MLGDPILASARGSTGEDLIFTGRPSPRPIKPQCEKESRYSVATILVLTIILKDAMPNDGSATQS